MLDNNQHLASLKIALVSATRALAHDAKLNVQFNAASNAEGAVLLPQMLEPPAAHELATIRGEADHAALTHHLHNPVLHRDLRPLTPANAQLFDVLENIRVESLGSQHMQGVKLNLYRRYEQRAMQQGLPRERPLPLLLELNARRYVQEMPIPAFLANALEESHAQMLDIIPYLEQLREKITDQYQFGKAALEVIEALAHIKHSSKPGDDNGEQSGSQSKTAEKPREDSAEDALPSQGGDTESTEQELSQMMLKPAGPGAEAPEGGQEIKLSGAPQHTPTTGHNELTAAPYHAYTTSYDEVVAAHLLAAPAELEQLSRQLDQKLTQFQSITSKLAARLQRLLLARQARHWAFDQEDGMLDNRKLARLIIHPEEQLIYKHEKDSEFRDTIVTLLIDNSGSMRGRPITIAALSADIISRTLERCGVKVEVLGFTTREWKGGNSYKQWMREGRPPHPGRLNDLRHIIYKSADMSWRKARGKPPARPPRATPHPHGDFRWRAGGRQHAFDQPQPLSRCAFARDHRPHRNRRRHRTPRHWHRP
ncbi:MAG: cobaltochelatase subunit CobT [Alphaproteobacteria bacterium]|nr:cobaltochelatase subunit CobT [Alphaproteobacteria bacterium]